MSTSAVRRSLFVSSGARLGADAGTYVASFVAGVVIARYLGPSTKGVYSVIVFVGGLVAQAGGLGVGEAAVLDANSADSSLPLAWHRTIPVLLISSAAAAVVFLALSPIVVGHWHEVLGPILVAAAGLPPVIIVSAANQLFAAVDRTIETSVIAALTTTLSTALLSGLLILAKFGLVGALIGSTVGAGAALVITAYFLPRYGLPFGLLWSPSFVRRALTFGGVLQLGYLVGSLAGRFDLLLVYWLSGRRSAGLYSVGLTAGWVVGAAAWAISFASFPRIAAASSASEASDLAMHTTRIAGAAGTISGILLAALTPVMLPVVFGARFSPAVVPALVLIPGGVVTSMSMVLCRALAGTGRARPYLWSASSTLCCMTVADLAAIPLFGITGAAVVSTMSSCVGLYVAAEWARRLGVTQSRRRTLPSSRDFVFVFTAGGRIGGHRREV